MSDEIEAEFDIIYTCAPEEHIIDMIVHDGMLVIATSFKVMSVDADKSVRVISNNVSDL